MADGRKKSKAIAGILRLYGSQGHIRTKPSEEYCICNDVSCNDVSI